MSPHVSVIWTLENHRDAVVVPSFLNKIDFVFSETSKQMQNLYFQGKGISWIMSYSPSNLGNIWKFLKLSGDLPHNQKYKTSGHQFIYLPLCSNSLDYHRNKEADDHLLNVAMNVSVTSPHQGDSPTASSPPKCSWSRHQGMLPLHQTLIRQRLL